MTWVLDGKPVRRILVTRLRYLGDVVMSTVVLAALKRGDPSVELGFLCESEAAPVLADHPLLERLHVLATGRRGRDARARSSHRDDSCAGNGAANTVRQLRSVGYDLAVDLFFNPRSAVLLRAAGIPARIGGARSWRRALYTHTVVSREDVLPPEAWEQAAPGGLGDHLCRLGPLRHEESGLEFGPWLARQSATLPVLPQLGTRVVGASARQALAAVGVDPDSPYLVLAPGATWPSKAWPWLRWSDLAGEIAAQDVGKMVMLTAPPGSSGQADPPVAIPPGRGGVLPVLPLHAVLDVIAAARSVVSVDGGIMHAAVGLNVPTVGIFGPTEPDIWFPYDRDPRFVVLAQQPPCHPCHLHECGAFSCLPGLRVSEVMAALTGLATVTVGPERNAAPGVHAQRVSHADLRRKDVT